ncbi:MAG: B12-binding domain-containing radical SAM protein [Nanoarchaeota archaeon]|nr:B12-binding domain-containing radical SAM protein [Nanoarchaeota archaeon]
MKVLLTTLPSEGEFVNWTTPKHFQPSAVKYMPLGILSIASNLPASCEVIILDPPSEGWTIKKTIEKIEKEKPDVLGISAISRRVYALNQLLKNTTTPYKAVGGPHATYYADQILENGADAVFVGSLADNEFKKAISKKQKGIIQCCTNINEINFPKRDLLKVEDYFPKDFVLFKAENRLPMFSSIGCPNHCNFCNVQEKRVQRKNPKTIIEEIKHLISLGCKSIHFLDDNFNTNEEHLHKILDEMEKEEINIEWSGRGEAIISERLAKRLADNNFKRIHVGLEALDDNILKYFRKPIRTKNIHAFCNILKKNNIDILGYFIVGTPIETEEYRENLPKKIKNLGIKYPFFNILFPEPDTDYYNSLLKNGIYKKNYWKEFMKNPTPYFEIPYPYGEEKKKEIIEYVNGLIKEFKPN